MPDKDISNLKSEFINKVRGKFTPKDARMNRVLFKPAVGRGLSVGLYGMLGSLGGSLAGDHLGKGLDRLIQENDWSSPMVPDSAGEYSGLIAGGLVGQHTGTRMGLSRSVRKLKADTGLKELDDFKPSAARVMGRQLAHIAPLGALHALSIAPDPVIRAMSLSGQMLGSGLSLKNQAIEHLKKKGVR